MKYSALILLFFSDISLAWTPTNCIARHHLGGLAGEVIPGSEKKTGMRTIPDHALRTKDSFHDHHARI